MKSATLLLVLFAASVQAAIPTPSLPSGLPSLTKTSTASTATSSSQVPKCVLSCAGSSIASSGSKCASIQDPCVCTDTKFQDAMNKCLKSCTSAEQLAAKGLMKGVCAAVNSTSTTSGASGSATASAGAGGSSNSSATSNTTTTAATGSSTGNSALAVQIEFAQTSFFALTVVVAGAVMGGLLI